MILSKISFTTIIALASTPGLLQDWGTGGPKGSRVSVTKSILMLRLKFEVLRFHKSKNVTRKGAC